MKCDGKYQDYSTAGKQKTEVKVRRVAWEQEHIRFKVVAYTKLSFRHLQKTEQQNIQSSTADVQNFDFNTTRKAWDKECIKNETSSVHKITCNTCTMTWKMAPKS